MPTALMSTAFFDSAVHAFADLPIFDGLLSQVLAFHQLVFHGLKAADIFPKAVHSKDLDHLRSSKQKLLSAIEEQHLIANM
jgi:hypothetical protein